MSSKLNDTDFISGPTPPPQGASANSYSLGGVRKTRYAPPPGMTPIADPSRPPGIAPGPVDHGSGSFSTPMSSAAPMMPPPSAPMPQASAYNPPAMPGHPATQVPELVHHWFYKIRVSGGQEQWKPFTMIDSVAIESIYKVNANANEPIPVDGGRYDAFINDRLKRPVFWNEDPLEIRRSSW